MNGLLQQQYWPKRWNTFNELCNHLQVSGSGLLSPILFSAEQIELFQKKVLEWLQYYEDEMHVSWLQQQNPDDLPYNLSSSTTTVVQVDEQTEPPTCNGTNDKGKETESWEQLITKPLSSLLASLASTREFLTELKEILGEKKIVASKAPTKSKSTARVLTSAKSLSIWLKRKKRKKSKSWRERKSTRRNV